MMSSYPGNSLLRPSSSSQTLPLLPYSFVSVTLQQKAFSWKPTKVGRAGWKSACEIRLLWGLENGRVCCCQGNSSIPRPLSL